MCEETHEMFHAKIFDHEQRESDPATAKREKSATSASRTASYNIIELATIVWHSKSQATRRSDDFTTHSSSTNITLTINNNNNNNNNFWQPFSDSIHSQFN